MADRSDNLLQHNLLDNEPESIESVKLLELNPNPNKRKANLSKDKFKKSVNPNGSIEFIDIREFNYNKSGLDDNKNDRTAKFEGLLGRGGFSTVIEAKWINEDKKVALKFMEQSVSRIRQGNNVEMFDKELITQSKLSHKNITQLIGQSVDLDRSVIILEFADGGSLSIPVMDKNLSDNTRIKWAKMLAVAVHYLHESCEHQILHRDIKIDNVLVFINKHAAKKGDLENSTVNFG